MKNYILIPFLSLMLFGATSSFAQDKSSSDEEKATSSKSCCAHDFHCYRAWKKEFKREKKECRAREMACYRPFASERKMRKACKKAWKRDILEHDHEFGYDHDYWF